MALKKLYRITLSFKIRHMYCVNQMALFCSQKAAAIFSLVMLCVLYETACWPKYLNKQVTDSTKSSWNPTDQPIEEFYLATRQVSSIQ